MDEIEPGLFHWPAFRETIGMDVHSYWIAPAGIVLDPMVPDDVGLDWWDDAPPQGVLPTRPHRADTPQQVVLPPGLHWRDTPAFVERFGCEVRAAAPALERWKDDDDRTATP